MSAQPFGGQLAGLHRGRNIACRQLRDSQGRVGKAFDEAPEFGCRFDGGGRCCLRGFRVSHPSQSMSQVAEAGAPA